MRKWILILIFFCFATLSKAQTPDEWGVDNKALNIPPSQTTSTAAIAEYVKENFDNDRKKLRAVYIWVAANIKYTLDSANVINLGLDPEAKITAAFRRRKGVCENYAAIFNDICTRAGLTSFIVDGYTKQNGFVDKTGHSWCAVFIDNTWLLCDPTWDNENGSNTKYFLVPPMDMIGSHMPFDPMWQLLNYPVSHDQFYSGNIYQNKNTPYFNYADTIAAYVRSDSLQRFRSTAFRIQKSGVQNDLVRNRLEFNKMHIEIIREDKDVNLYNSSVADLNEAKSAYNNFVQYYNKQFTPSITDKALEALLEGIDTKLSNAHKKLDEIARSEATFTFSTDELRKALNALAVKVQEQEDFLKLYLNTATAKRQSLFYKQVTSSGK
jgi:Transglutaminase-like superfamily.